MTPDQPLHRYNLTLLGSWGVFWIAMAVSPVDRGTWLLENVLVFVAVPSLLLIYRHLAKTSDDTK